jgi:hypothetical protein
MPLPIPLGGISTSSQVIPSPNLDAEVGGNDGYSERTAHPLYQSVAFASCPSQEWQARVVASFYDVKFEKKGAAEEEGRAVSNGFAREKTMVEIRIQVSPLSCHLSDQRYRETSYHLKLMDGAHNDNYPQSQHPRVVFSQDRKYLIVLLYHPHQDSPTVMIFQLRKPRHHNVHPMDAAEGRPAIPIPSYISIANGSIGYSGNNDNGSNYGNILSNVESPPLSPAVATNPKFASVWGITAICPLPAATNNILTTAANDPNNTAFSFSALPSPQSILLAACQDGTLVWIDLKTAQVCARGRVPPLPLQKADSMESSVDEGSSESSLKSSYSSGEYSIRMFEESSTTAQSQSAPFLPITSMKASPTSSLESGTVALVTAAHSSSSTVDKNSKSRPAECILASWSFESTTPRRRTLLKRASTGTVATEEASKNSLERSDKNETQRGEGRGLFQKQPSNSRRRKAPSRTFSDTFQTLLKSPNNTAATRKSLSKSPTRTRQRQKGEDRRQAPQNSTISTNELGNGDSSSGRKRFVFRSKSMEKNANELAEKLSNVSFPSLGNLVRSENHGASEEEKEESALQQRKLFVLQELQKRPISGSPPAQEQEECQVYEDIAKTPPNGSRKPPMRTGSGSSLLGKFSRASAPLSPQSPLDTNDDKMIPNRRHPRRKSNPDKVDTNQTWHDMKVEILSTWSGTTGNSEGEHQHLLSKKAVVDVCFGALSSILCVLYKSSSNEMEKRQRLAQVLTVSESGNLSPVASLFLSLEQIQHATSVKRDTATVHDSSKTEKINHRKNVKIGVGEANIVSFNNLYSFFGLEYVSGQDSFVVNSVFGGYQRHWLACAWRWRDDALGWLIQNNSLLNLAWSKLHFCQDTKSGSQFVQLQSHKTGSATETVEVFKRIVPAATLSPWSTRGTGGFENSNLMITSVFVGIPHVTSKATDISSLELKWKMSSLPVSYISAYGPPRMAAIGATHSKSIAVASSHGLCVWNMHYRHRWKHFGTPIEEKSFTVLGMVWWEGRKANQKLEEEGDLLIAIIRTNTGHQYLSCWSPQK